MELGKPCKPRKEVKEAIINLEAKKSRLGEIWMDADGRPGGLQDEWLRTILLQMLDRETTMHLGEKISSDGISYDRAKSIITDFIRTILE